MARTSAASWSACRYPPQDKAAFDDFLQRLGYEYAAESDNPAYRMFLSASTG